MQNFSHLLRVLLAVLPLGVADHVHAQNTVATDKAGLVALYNDTDGANWTDSTNWGTDQALSTWHGVTTNSDGRVTELELDGNGLSGTLPIELGDLTELASLRLNGNVYLAGPLPVGLRELSALATVDLADTELCAPEDDAFQTWLDAISFSGLICPPESQTVIDVAVFYTPAARDNAGGTAAIEAEIDLMAAETNLAYRASGVNQRVVLAAVEEVEYTAKGATREDIDRLQDPSDGHMDEVHTTRDQVAADTVVLIVIGHAGIAYDILTPANASAANAFATSGVNSRTFAHELGHLMGLDHDRYVACVFDPSGLGGDGCSEAATAYAYGYVNQQAFEEDAPVSARWRTVMAYDSQCHEAGCPQLLRFSNPDQIYPDPGGDPLGVAGREPSTALDGPADAVRTLNRTRATVANFRTPTAVTVSFGAAAYTAAEGGEAATVTVNLSPAPGRPVSVPLVSVGATGATASDYTAPGSVAFAATETAQTFTVTAVDDAADDDGETVTLAFDTRVLPSGMTVGSPATATVTLDDDDLVTAAASVSAVALTSDPGPDAIYALGDEIEATVRFDKSVTVTGTPQLGLTVGSGTRPMTHRGGAGEVLTFAYTVAEDDSDTDGVSIAADSLSGTIRDTADEDAMLTHVAVEADAGHRVDGVRPLLQGAVADGNRLTLTYAEALHEGSLTETQFHAPDAFTVTSGGNAVRVDQVAVMQQTVRLDLSGWVLRGDAVTVSYSPGANPIRDAAGNEAAAFSDRSATNETPQPHYDTDHDGLIEITTLAQLDAVRHDLDGDGTPSGISGAAVYRAAFPLAFSDEQARRLGCHGACIGYELLADLDFLDVNGDGRVDTDDDTNGDGRVAAEDTTWWNGGAGWDPIRTGGQASYFAEFFEGNGHAIRHLFINRPSKLGVGLFANSSSNIRNVGVIEIDVTGNTGVGGLVGINAGRIEASYATGPVSGTTNVGGLVGASGGPITTSYATGPVSGEAQVGGLVGYGNGRIEASYATGPVWGTMNVGGLVGSSRGPITTSYATGPVSGEAQVGGLVGYGNGRIAASYATGPVSGTINVGGLGGFSGGPITTSYATGPVSGKVQVGGLVGDGNGGIAASYATGPVSGTTNVGGLVGASGGPITTSYATGPVSGEVQVGGLVGLSPSGEIHASYWDTTTSGQATSDHGTGQTTAQLETPTDATGIYADWDDDVWNFGEDDEYPALAVDFDGDGDATWQEFGYQLREGPTLTANPGQGQVGLSWTAVTVSHWTPAPSVTYTLTRNDGAISETLGAGLSGLTFTDIDVTAGVTYTYQVAAVVQGGEASRSAQVAVVVPAMRPTVTLRLMPSSVSENGGRTTVTARLSAASTEATTVTVSATAVSPAVAGDFTLSTTKTLTITAGGTGSTGTVTITANNNAVDAPDKTVMVQGTATNSAGVTGPSAMTLTIIDDDAAPSLVLSVSASMIDEDGGMATVIVSTGSGSTYATAQTVRLAVAGTATETADYMIGGKTLTLPAGAGTGASMVSATVTGVDDSLDDDGETIEITGSRNGVAFGSRQTIAIEDDDWPELTVTFRQADYRVAEGGHVDLPVTLSAAPERQVTIPIKVEVAGGAEAVDYSVSPASLTFGASETDKTLRVSASNDGAVDPGEGVTLSFGTTLPERISEGGIAEATVAIRDTDFTFAPAFAAGAGTTESDTDVYAVSESSSVLRLSLRLETPRGARVVDIVDPVVVTLATRENAGNRGMDEDYATERRSGTFGDYGKFDRDLSFAPGDFSDDGACGCARAEKAVSVDLFDDRVRERVEVFGLRLARESGRLSLSSKDVTIRIIEDDAEPALTLDANPARIAEAGGVSTVTVSTGAGSTFPSAQTIRFELGGTATRGADYTIDSTSLTLPAGMGEDPSTVTTTVRALDDPFDDNAETVALSATRDGVEFASRAVAIADDDIGSTRVDLAVNPAQVREDAGATTVRVTATLDAAAREEDTDVAVTVGASGDSAVEGTDYATVPDLTLTIDAGETMAETTFRLAPTNDSAVEGARTITVDGSAPGLAVRSADLTLNDDDVASTTVTLTLDPLEVGESAGSRAVRVTGTLDGGSRPTATVVAVTVGSGADTAAEGEDYQDVGNLELTIPANRTDGTVTFTLRPTNDRTAEGTETISVRGDVAGLTVMPAELALADDDEPSTRLDLSLSPSTVSEAAAPTEVAVTGSLDAGARTSDTFVTVTVGALTDTATEGLDYAYVSALAITIPANETAGQATFTLSPDNDAIAEGAETISVAGRASGLTVAPAALTLSDNDRASRVVTLSADPELVSEDAPADVAVTASLDAGARAEDTGVRLTVGAAGDTAVPGTDYARVSERTLTILSGETGGTATFRLEPLDNDSADGARTLSVTGSTTVAELRIEPASGARIALADDDSPAVLVTPDRLTVAEAESDTYAVALQTRPTADVTVTITGVSGDLSLDRTSLVFAGADWSDPQEVEVTAADDADSARDPDVTLTHRASGAAEYRGLRAELVVSIRENDPSLVFSETALAVPEGETATYTVALATVPTGDVTVRITGASGDLSLDKTRLAFTPGDWDDAQTITVEAAEDDDTSTDAAVTLTHEASGGGYDGVVGTVRARTTGIHARRRRHRRDRGRGRRRRQATGRRWPRRK